MGVQGMNQVAQLPNCRYICNTISTSQNYFQLSSIPIPSSMNEQITSGDRAPMKKAPLSKMVFHSLLQMQWSPHYIFR